MSASCAARCGQLARACRDRCSRAPWSVRARSPPRARRRRRRPVAAASRRCGAAPRTAPACAAPARDARAPRCARRARAGRKPSNTKRSVGQPATASAAVTAEGPAMLRTSRPAAATARTSMNPGSDSSGVPASLTSASTSPRRSRSSSASTRLASLWSWSESSGREMPQAASSVARAARVFGQHQVGGAQALAIARGLRSPILPIGVAMTSSLPAPPATIISRSSHRTPSLQGAVLHMQTRHDSFRSWATLAPAPRSARWPAARAFRPPLFRRATGGRRARRPADAAAQAAGRALESAARRAEPAAARPPCSCRRRAPGSRPAAPPMRRAR